MRRYASTVKRVGLSVVRTLLVTLALLTLLAFGVSCRSTRAGETPQYDHIVTFNYNYGNKQDANCPPQYLGVKDGGLVGIRPGHSDSFALGAIQDMYMAGWYTPRLGEDGQPLTDPDTGVVLVDRLWDFETDTVTADVTLYAHWVEQPTLTFRDKDTGEALYTMREAPGTLREEPKTTLDNELGREGYTLRGCYADREGTTAFSWPYTFTEGDTTVWVSYIEGNWMMVRTPAEFDSGISANANLYIENDIDFSDSKTTWITRDFNGQICGNGHTLRGIHLKLEGSKNKSRNFALFGTLRESAWIHDVTFADVEIDFSARITGGYAVAGFAWAAKEGARLENVTLTGSLTYDISRAPTSTVSPWLADRADADPADFPGCDWSGFILREAG